MNRILNFRYWATITLASLFVALSYELNKQDVSFFGLPTYLVAVLAFAVGAGAAKLIVDSLLKFKLFRKWVAGTTWIEGYWLLKTDPPGGGGSPFTRLGVLYLEHKIARGVLKAVTTRLDDNGNEIFTHSQIAHAQSDEDNLRYINYFRVIHPLGKEQKGILAAEFSSTDHFFKEPQIFQGKLTLEGDEKIRRQLGKKISDEIVADLQTKYGNRWKEKVIESDGKLAFP